MELGAVKKKLREGNYICFTTDLDWAPEIAIEKTLKMFRSNQIRPTVFVTHPSQIVNSFADDIDLGIHPNFIAPSSQGETQDEIIDYCMKLVNKTKIFRCHRWFSSNDIYDKLWSRGIRYDSNICTNMDIVEPFMQRSGMISFPVFWEDGAYIIHHTKLDFEKEKESFRKNGLKVINIHPMHYALNTPYFQYTRKIKDELSRDEWREMDADKLERLSYHGMGIRNFIDEIVRFTKAEDICVVTLEQVYSMLDHVVEKTIR